MLALFYPWLSTFFVRTIAEDCMEFSVPFLIFEKQALAEGHVPFWNPYAQAGTPHFASPSFYLFYPLHWLIYFFPPVVGINVLHLLHGVIGWAGMYLFCRQFSSKTAASAAAWVFLLATPVHFFMKGGYHGTYYTVCLMPMCLWLLHRSLSEDRIWPAVAWACGAGIGVGMCFSLLATYSLIFVMIPCLLYGLFFPSPIGRRIRCLGILFVETGLIAAARIWPWYLLAAQSNRSAGAADLAFSAAGSVHPMFLFNYLFPETLTGLGDSEWIFRGYRAFPWPIALGVLPLLFVNRSFWRIPQGRFFIVLYVFVMVMSLGVYSPLFLFFFYVVPGFSVASHPNLYTWVAAFAGAGIIALAVDGAEACRRMVRRLGCWAAGLFLLTLACLWLVPVESRLIEHFLEHREGFSVTNVLKQSTIAFRESSSHQGFALVRSVLGEVNAIRWIWALVWMAAAVVVLRVRAIPQRSFLLMILLGLDLATHPTFPWSLERPENHYPTTRLHDRLQETAATNRNDPFRVYPVGGPYNTPFFKFNQGCILRLESIKGESGFLLRNSSRYFNLIQGWPLGTRKLYAQFYGTMKRTDSRLLDLLSVRYFLSDTPLADRRLVEVANEAGLFLYENPQALPRAFFSKSVRAVDSIETLFERIQSEAYDPREVLYTLEPIPAETPPDTNAIGRAQIRREGPNAWRIVTESPTGGWLCIGEVMTPGWKARLDDHQLLDIVMVNGLFQSVRVPGGRHEIFLRYRPPGLEWGALAGGMGVVMCLGAVGMSIRKKTHIS